MFVCLSVWMCFVKLSHYSHSFSRTLTKLGTHDLHTNMQKNGTDFWNFAFKIFRILFKILHRRLSSYHTRWTEFLSAAPPPPPEIFSRHLVGGYSREHWLVPVCKKKHHLVGWLRWGPRLVSRLGSAVRVSASFLNFSLGVISGGGNICKGVFQGFVKFWATIQMMWPTNPQRTGDAIWWMLIKHSGRGWLCLAPFVSFVPGCVSIFISIFLIFSLV